MSDIPEKESLTVEFKSDLKKYPDSEIINAVIGMANTSGGTLYLGVEDDGSVSGLNKKHNDIFGAAAMIANKTVPSISVRAEIIEKNGLPVMAIEIPESSAVVASIDGRILRRRLKADGTPENIPMYPFEINSRLSELGLLDYSAKVLAESELDDLDPDEVKRLKDTIANNPGGEKMLLELSDDELLKALHFVKTEETGEIRPTVAGILMVGREESIKRLMPTVRSDFQVLHGTAVQINESFTKPIIKTAELFDEYFKPWNPEKEIEDGPFRIGIPEFSKSAFREGLLNAFAHRDYTMLGRIRVAINDEGLTISSPGGFIEGVSLDNLINTEPHGRNQTLSDAMKRIGLAEKTGRGIDKIFAGSIEFGRPWPDYSESVENRVTLFIPRANPDIEFTRQLLEVQRKNNMHFAINYLLVLSVLRENSALSVAEISERTKINSARTHTILNLLTEYGMIRKNKSGRNETYSWFSVNAKSVRKVKINDEDFEEQIIEFAKKQNDVFTTHEISELLHIPSYKAYNIISKLVESGKAEKLSSGKYAKYKIVR